MLDFDFDSSFLNDEIKIVCGTDEAGRGPLAGHVAAAACILKPGVVIDGLDDSKKLTEKRREAIFDRITESCIAYGIAFASPCEIDEINILNASLLAMKRAVNMMSVKPDLILVDGNKAYCFDSPAISVIKGDAKSQSIAAASVLAKVTRDRLCAKLDSIYPQYGFSKHKGYPTKDHMIAVYKYGPCPEHRVSFLSFLKTKEEMLKRACENED